MPLTMTKHSPIKSLTATVLLLVSIALASCGLKKTGGTGIDGHALFLSFVREGNHKRFQVVTEEGKVAFEKTFDLAAQGEWQLWGMPALPLSHVVVHGDKNHLVGIDIWGNRFENLEGLPVDDYSEGLAPAKPVTSGASGVCGYVDTSYKMSIPASFDECGAFSEGLAAVRRGNRNWAFIDKTGKIRLPFGYVAACAFSEGLAMVWSADGGKVIDTSGKTAFLLERSVNECTSFVDGRMGLPHNYRIGFVDKSGNFVIPAKYSNIGRFNNGHAYGVRDNSFQLLDVSGNEKTVPSEITVMHPFDYGLSVVETKNGFGLLDGSGRYVAKPEYASILALGDGYLAAFKSSPKSKFSILDPKGREIEKPRDSCTRYYAGVFVCIEEATNKGEVTGISYLLSGGKRIGGVSDAGLTLNLFTMPL